MKALKVVGIVIGVLVVVLLAVPMFYDVNTKVKPLIQKAIEENLNAKAEIGKLSLGVLLGVNIGIESLKIIETADNNVFFEMKDAKLKIPYSSLLSGKVSVTLNANSPTIRLNRDAQGNLNVSKLMKPKSETPTEKPSEGSDGGAAGASRVYFSTDIVDANIEFKDKQAGTDYKINQLSFISHNIGMGHPFKTTVSANLDVDNKKDMKVRGKLVLDGTTEIAMAGGDFEKLTSKAKLDLTDVEVRQPSLNKEKGSALTLDTDFAVTKDMKYSGHIVMKGSDFRVAGFVPKATDVVGDLQINTGELEIKKVAMKVGSSDFNLTGNVKNFEAPVVNLTYTSKKLNLDEMLPHPTKSEAEKAAAQPEDPQALEKSLAELEGPIAMVRQNPVLRKMNLRAQTTIDSLIMKNAEISNVKAVATFRDLVLSMENTSLTAFNGAGDIDLKIDFNQRKPSYTFKAKVQKLDTNKAMVSQFKDLDKTLTGLANANFEVRGVGVSMDDLNKNLRGSGNMNVENGSWSGLGVLKMVGDKLKGIPKAGEAVSGIKISDKFKTLKSDFTIDGGRFNIVNGIMEMDGANTSVTLNGFVTFTKDMLMKGDIVAPMGQVPKKMATNDGRGKVPYEVKGKVNDPKVDWDKTLGPVATAFAQQEGEKLIKKEADKLKNDAVKKLFKGIKL